MTRAVVVLSMLVCVGHVHAQDAETYVLRQAVSNRKTIVYTRTIRLDAHRHLFHVQDRYEDGRLQMDAFYTPRPRAARTSNWQSSRASNSATA